MRRRLFVSLIALACIAMFAVTTGNRASAQADCTYYTLNVDPFLAGCLPLDLTTYWGNPIWHTFTITATGTTIVPAPIPPGTFFAPFYGLSVNGSTRIIPPGANLLLPCGRCARITIAKDPATGCIVITFTAIPGPC